MKLGEFIETLNYDLLTFLLSPNEKTPENTYATEKVYEKAFHHCKTLQTSPKAIATG